MQDLNLEVAKAREKRPDLRKSRLTIDLAHESDDVHEEAHMAAIEAACRHNGVIFLGGVSDGEPFDNEPEPEVLDAVEGEDGTFYVPGLA